MKSAALIFVSVMLITLSSCKHVVKYDCTGVTPTYTKNIKPILDATCARSGCHGANDPEGDINLSNYQDAAAASRKNSFMGTIQHKPFYQNMPKDGDRLPDSQIHLLSCWIENGSPE